MSAAFVVDCSIAMAWLFHDEATPKTAALLNRLATESALVPTWWFIEITNVLAMAERKGRVTPKQSDAFIADLGKLGIERDDEALLVFPSDQDAFHPGEGTRLDPHTPACGEMVEVLAEETIAKSISPDLTSCRICGSCPSCPPGYWSTSIVPLLNSLSLAEKMS